MTSVYLDVCCLNRPFDDQTQSRIRLEAEAVVMILARCQAGDWEWVSSKVVDLEIDRTPDPGRRRRARLLASAAHRRIQMDARVVARAQELEARGIDTFDALHLACAESGNVDVILSTDDRLVHRCADRDMDLHVRVVNPLAWIQEEG